MNVQVVMRQSEPADQAALSELLGEYTTQEFSRSLDGATGEPKGDFRAKAVTRPYVTPGQIAALPVGQGYVRIAGGRPVATVFPNVAGAAAEEPDAEAEDDDGTPDAAGPCPGQPLEPPFPPAPTPAKGPLKPRSIWCEALRCTTVRGDQLLRAPPARTVPGCGCRSTPRDALVFGDLYRHRVLSVPWLARVRFGGSQPAARERLRKLRRAGYVERLPTARGEFKGYRLTARGRREIGVATRPGARRRGALVALLRTP